MRFERTRERAPAAGRESCESDEACCWVACCSSTWGTGALSGEPIESLTAWYEDYLSNGLKNGAPKMTLVELKALPGAVWVDKGGTRYEKFAEELKPEQVKTAVFDGKPKAEGTAIYDKPKDQKGRGSGP